MLSIRRERLWGRLMEMAAIGATPAGGCNRPAASDEDRAGRDLFVRWAREARMTVQIDAIGNIFARRPGLLDHLPPVLMGSHLDTQPTGGRFDGVYGVLAGLEVVETLNDHGILTDAPLEVAVWTNEEGSRFSPACLGSGVFAGVFDLDETLRIEDKRGKRLGDELQRIGYLGSRPAPAHPILAALELHIEQGPILEAESKTIGVVTGIQGLFWYDLIIDGEAAHAGPTPMERRRDPFTAALPIMEFCYRLAKEHAPWARVTFGDIRAEPGSRNTVPHRLTIAVDLRHPDADILASMDRAFRRSAEEECLSRALSVRVAEHWRMPVTRFAPQCVTAVAEAAQQLDLPNMEIVSGAGHDSLYLARVAPTGMIFVPCRSGLSHNEAEYAAPEDCEAGCNVLLNAVRSLARVSHP